MVRYMGMLLILVVSFGAAALIKKENEKKLSFLGELISFVGYIKTQIIFCRTPRERIYAGFDSPLLDGAGFTAALSEAGWEKATAALTKQGYIDADISRSLLKFGSGLGESRADEEGQRCDRVIIELEDALDKLQREIPAKNKIASSLTVLCALTLIIIIF